MTRKKFGQFAAFFIGLLLALSTAHVVLRQLHVANWMYFAQDDFFYYVKVAQNLAAGRGSTFNGIVPTNGYHPLWLLLITAVVKISSTEHALRLFLSLSVWLATMASYIFSWLLLRRGGVDELLSSIAAAFVAAFSMHIFTEGMEVTLTIPCMLALLVVIQKEDLWSRPGVRGFMGSFAVGLLASATILSRLDTVIFAGLLALAVVFQPELRRKIKSTQCAAIALGLLPVPIYVVINRVFFGAFSPISGFVKDLKVDHGFTGRAWLSVSQLTLTQHLNIAFVAIVLILLPLIWQKLRPIERVLVPATLAFPFCYFVLLSWMSDWRLWGWYFYSLRAALCVALLVLFRFASGKALARSTLFVCLFGAFTLYRIATLKWDVGFPAIVDAAEELRTFASTHPGTYAMGDRAGAASYLLPNPIIQTEGLMMDRHFAQFIKQQTPLRAALAEYGARYYVGSSWAPYSGCFQAAEPQQAGPHAPHMRGEFCQQPLARWTHEDVETLVFDLRKP